MKTKITIIVLLAFFGLSSLVDAQIPTNGLIAYYPFTGNANDLSGNSNNGTVNGATLTTDRFSNANSAYHFNGSSNYISVNNSATFPQTAISICYWLNRGGHVPTNKENYISKEQAFQSYQMQNSHLQSGFYSGTPGVWSQYDSHYTLANNSNWVFYTFTFDNTTHIASTYINGVLDTFLLETDPNFIVKVSSNPMYIGRNGSASVWYINGDMDDIRIYNRAIDPCEVSQLFYENATMPNLQTGLIGYYPFTGNANDLSGNANNGTVYGATLTTDRFGNANCAYSFNGSSNYIQVNNSATFPQTAISICFWLNRMGTGYQTQDEDYIMKEGAFGSVLQYPIMQSDLYTNPSWKAYYSQTAISNNSNWVFYCFTYDNATMIANTYINGILDTTFYETNPNAIVRTSSNPMYIGKNPAGVWFVHGKIDDIRIYDRVIISCEIDSLYNVGGWSNLNSCLVADYPFNGNANDVSGNLNNGTVYGATLTTDRFGNPNSAYSFDGVDNYITTVDNAFDFAGSHFSISLWAKWADLSVATHLFDKQGYPLNGGDGYRLFTNGPGGALWFAFSSNPTHKEYPSAFVPQVGTWYNITVVNDDSLKVFVNNQLIIADTTAFIAGNNAILTFGKRVDFNGSPMNGIIDDINIYNCALDQAEIDSLYNACNIIVSQAGTPTGTTPLCINPSNTTYTTTGATNATAYTWEILPTNAGTITGTGTTAIVDWNNSFTGTASIHVKGTNGSCEGIFSNTISVTINALPIVTLGSFNSVCVNTASYTLTGGSPTGGTYSGTGVSGGVFNPSTAGVGTQTITYTYTDGFGCANTASSTITVNALPTVTLGSFNSVCVNVAPFTLTGGSPTGGTYSGTGVSGGSFNPTTAGLGTHTITYTYTNGLGCANIASSTITVNALTTVTLGSFNSVCINTAPFTLTGGSPTGGTYSGTGLSGGSFNPATAGVGTHTITYTYTNGFGCANSATSTITVNALPTVTLGSFNSVCLNTSPFTLSGGSPTGGTYSGTGVSGGVFNPLTAGVGTHTITYTYTNGLGCANIASSTIIVNAVPSISISGLNSSYCLNAAAVTLSATPTGGSFSGPGVNGNIFNPANAGTGNHTITYTVTQSGCTNSASQNVTVNALPVVNFTGLNPSYSTNDGPSTLIGIPAGGVFSGEGISGNIFSPANAGIGGHNIVYVYTDGNGCMNATCQTTDLITKVGEYNNPDNTINIFPNPNNGTFQITFNVSTSQNIKMEIFNDLGQIVYTENKNNYFGQFNETIDLRSFSSSVYFVITKIGEKTFSNKVIIEN